MQRANNMKRLIRNIAILTVLILVVIIASCSTQKFSSPQPVQMPAPPSEMRMLRICKDTETENDSCRKLGPTAVGADRGVQQEPRELP